MWDPFTRLDDAMMVAEKIEADIHLRRIGNEWVANFGSASHGLAKNPAEAIALAALAYLDATGFK
jgi:hypothetical protein